MWISRQVSNRNQGLKVESERTSEVVADSLIKEIKGNYLEIGATLPTERELCDRFSASRPTIREALRIMVQGVFTSGFQ